MTIAASGITRKDIITRAIGNGRIADSDILGQIRKLKAGSEDTPVFAELMVRTGRHYAAACLYAESGMNAKAVEIAGRAYGQRHSGNLYGGGFCSEIQKARMFVQVAKIYIEFGGEDGKAKALGVARECAGRPNTKSLYAVAGAEIYGMLGMHKEEAEMYENALRNCSGSDTQTQDMYIKRALAARGKLGPDYYESVIRLLLDSGDLAGALETLEKHSKV